MNAPLNCAAAFREVVFADRGERARCADAEISQRGVLCDFVDLELSARLLLTTRPAVQVEPREDGRSVFRA